MYPLLSICPGGQVNCALRVGCFAVVLSFFSLSSGVNVSSKRRCGPTDWWSAEHVLTGQEDKLFRVRRKHECTNPDKQTIVSFVANTRSTHAIDKNGDSVKRNTFWRNTPAVCKSRQASVCFVCCKHAKYARTRQNGDSVKRNIAGRAHLVMPARASS